MQLSLSSDALPFPDRLLIEFPPQVLTCRHACVCQRTLYYLLSFSRFATSPLPHLISKWTTCRDSMSLQRC